MLPSLQVHETAKKPIATSHSFLFTLVGCLKEEDHDLIKPYVFKHIKNENREAYLLGFPILPDTEETYFFQEQGYALIEHHLTIDRQYSNQHDCLSLAHGTLIYRHTQDGEAIIVHVHFDKKIALWSVRATKRKIDGQDSNSESFVLNDYQINKIKEFSRASHALLEDLFYERSIRHEDFVKKADEIIVELDLLSMDLQATESKQKYRERAAELETVVLELENFYGSTSQRSRLRYIQRMIALLGASETTQNPCGPSQARDVESLETPDALLSVSPIKMGLEADKDRALKREGDALFESMGPSSKKGKDLLNKSTQYFFRDFSEVVQELRSIVVQLILFNPIWKRPGSFQEKIKESEALLKELSSLREHKVQTFLKEESLHFEGVLSRLFEREHIIVIDSIFYFLVSLPEKEQEKNIEKLMKVMNWYFIEKKNLYSAVLKKIERVYIDDSGLMSKSFLRYISEMDFFDFFEMLLDHGFNPNGPGLKIGNAPFCSLLKSIIVTNAGNSGYRYIKLLLERGAYVDYFHPLFFHLGINREYLGVSPKQKSKEKSLDNSNIQKLLRIPSDLWLSLHNDRLGNRADIILIDSSSVVGLALGIARFAHMGNALLARILGSYLVPGIACFPSINEAQKALSLGQSPNNDRVNIRILMSFPEHFDFGLKMTQHFKNKAKNVKIINNAIQFLRNFVKEMGSNVKIFDLQLNIYGAIELLIAERTLLKPLDVSDIAEWMSVVFSISQYIDVNVQNNRRNAWGSLLQMIETLPPSLQRDTKVLPIYQLIKKAFEKLILDDRQQALLLLSAASQSAVSVAPRSPQSLQVPATAAAVVQPRESSNRPKQSGKK